MSKTLLVNDRSIASRYAGLDPEPFHVDKTMKVFGDAKTVVEYRVKVVE